MLCHRLLPSLLLLYGCGAGATGDETRAPAAETAGVGQDAEATPTPTAPVNEAGTGGGGEVPPASGGSSSASGGATMSVEPPASAGAPSFQQACAQAAQTECERCLCDKCSPELERCDGASGCAEILACVRDTKCVGAECYCGTYAPTSCLAGKSNGPCKATFLAAPGSREPTFTNPSAGPASDAALAINDCVSADDNCTAACPAGG